MKPELINLGFYRFYDAGPAESLPKLRKKIELCCEQLELKGTILIALEGVNVMLTGVRPNIEEFKGFARNTFGVSDQDFKEAPVAENSFHRMLVKIKKEIIPVGDPELKPHEKTAKRLSAAEYKKWIEEKRPMILLDTRNNYEVEVGTFEGAVHLNLESSRDFAAKASAHIKEWKKLPVLTFCTGGIRCEKASAFLLKQGLQEVYQLDGGILRYFEQNGGAHFQGSCFVFDWRLAVDGNLNPAPRSEDPEKEFGRHRKKSLLPEPG
jgi:UPF0176 protein